MTYRTHFVTLPALHDKKGREDIEAIFDDELNKWHKGDGWQWQYVDHIRLSDVNFLLIFKRDA